MNLDAELEIARYVLAATLVFANFAVWYGVWLERDSAPPEEQRRGWRILLFGLAAEIAIGVFMFATDAAINVRQRSEIASLEIQAGPRRLDEMAFVNALEGVPKPKKPVEIMYSRDSPDCLLLSMFIMRALSLAGWPHGQYMAIVAPEHEIELDRMEPLPELVGGQAAGVSIALAQDEPDIGPIGDGDKPRTPVAALWKAFRVAMPDHLLQISPGARGPSKGTIRIVVAPKL
jgi:hypothetical protein